MTHSVYPNLHRISEQLISLITIFTFSDHSGTSVSAGDQHVQHNRDPDTLGPDLFSDLSTIHTPTRSETHFTPKLVQSYDLVLTGTRFSVHYLNRHLRCFLTSRLFCHSTFGPSVNSFFLGV